MSVCTNQFPLTEVLYDEIDDETGLLVVTGICCLLTLLVLINYIEEIWFIIITYPHKGLRGNLIFQLGLFPTICFTSTLAVLIPRTTLIGELLASSYLSVCLFMFVKLIVAYFRGSNNMMELMDGEKMVFNSPPFCCCCVCLNKFPFNRKYFKRALYMVIQIIILRPLALFIVTVLWTDDRYTPGDESDRTRGVFYTNLVSIVSTLLGIWGLAVIFRSTRDKLSGFRIGMKFASVQIIMVLVNVQFAIISILARNDISGCDGTRDSLVRGYGIHHLLLTFESFLVAILARFAYRQMDPALMTTQVKDLPMSNNNIST